MLPFDPKKPLYGFTARAPHAKRRIHLFRSEQDDFIFFRPKNAPADWCAVFWGSYPTYWSVNERNWQSVEELTRPHLAQSQIWRVFEMADPRPDERRLWRIVWRPDFGYITPLGTTDLEKGGAYFWPHLAKLNLWKSSTDMLIRHFSREWADPQSDVRTALAWCDLNYEERDIRAVHWQRGNLEELKQVVCAAMQVLPVWDYVEHWYEEDKLSIALSWDERGQKVQLSFPLHSRSSPGWKRWEKLRARLEERNWGIYTVEGNRGDWAFPWVKYESPRRGRRGSAQWLEIGRPTQHEYLEASLILRDWLRDNAFDLLDDWF